MSLNLVSDHLTSNNLVNPHQSAYCKHYSTETALLYIHDHLINVIGSRKISCLCLLDLSAAFDTTDHNILLTRLSSWFGIHGTALHLVGAVVQLVEYRTRNQEVAGSTHTRSTASNIEQVANLLRAQANSASSPQRDGNSYGYGVKA